MSLWQFVAAKTQWTLFTVEQTGIGEWVTSNANEEVERTNECGAPGVTWKRYATPHRGKIGNYASENGGGVSLPKNCCFFQKNQNNLLG